jgi:diacylglycerol kinase (ATP)
MTLSNSSQPEDSVLEPLRVKLIFNPMAGQFEEASARLVEILSYLQAWQMRPEVYMVQPESRLQPVVAEAIQQGIGLIVACGGDGTIESMIGDLMGTSATLGIIPIGTRNNIAHSPGIPTDSIAEAVALLRQGRRTKIDVGHACCGRAGRWFLEAATVGLVSALYPSADEIQHGNLTRIGDFLATLVSHPASEVSLSLDDGRQTPTATAHVVLVANMPYFGAHFQVAPGVSYEDGRLDVLVYSQVGKLNLIEYAVQEMAGAFPDDPRIQHYRVKSVDVHTIPEMPVMADGVMLGNGSLSVTIRRHSLAVMASPKAGVNLASPAKSDPATAPDE